MGALDQVAQQPQEPVPSQLAGSPIYDIMSKMSQNMSQTMDQTSQFPEQFAKLGEQRQSALQQVQQATQAQANMKSPSQAFIDGWASQILAGHPDNAVPYAMWAENQQKESALGGNVATAKLGYDDITGQQKSLEDIYKTQMMTTGMKGGMGGMMGMMKQRPIKLADGTWGSYNAATGTVTPLAQADQAMMQKQYEDAYKLGEKILDTSDPAQLHQFATQHLQTLQDIRGNNPVMGVTPQGVAPIRPTSSPAPGSQGKDGLAGTPGTEVAIPTSQKTDMLTQLKGQEDAAVASGDYANAKELQKARLSIMASMQTPGAAPTTGAPATPGSGPAVPISQQPLTVPGAGMQLRTPEIKEAAVQQEKQFQDQYGKMAESYQTSSDSANVNLNMYKEVADVLKRYRDSGGQVGILQPHINQMKNVLVSLGVPMSEADLTGLSEAQVADKMQMSLATAAAKAISNARATQYDFQQGQKNVPGIQMYDAATQEWLRNFSAVANAERTRAEVFADWRSRFPRTDPTQFTAYWNLLHDFPDAQSRFSPSKIESLSKASGVPPIQVIQGLKQRLGATNAKP
jgi:hypothetical protein